jgi:thymidylate synthase (FAD)
MLKLIEDAGKTCYKSESGGTASSYKAFAKKMIDSGHHSVIEHGNISVRIITDRGVTHELVRHRLAAYSQESTRYCNYSKDKFGNAITVILPVWFYSIPDEWHSYQTIPGGYTLGDAQTKEKQYYDWKIAMARSEESYFMLLDDGQTPQEARSVLPNSLKTEIVMTANLREWRHVFSLRCSPKAHPQIRELMIDMLTEFRNTIPVIFDDIPEA